MTTNLYSLFKHEGIRKFSAITLLSISALLLVLCFSGCNYNNEGIAAKVGDTNIMEDEITEVVYNFRSQNNLTSDAEWYTYLDSNKQKASDVRDGLLEDDIDKEVIHQLAEQYGVVVTQEERQNELNLTIEAMGGQEAFEQSLTQYGLTVADYMESLDEYLIEKKVAKILVDNAEVSQETINEFWATYSNKMRKARGYYQIIFPNSQASKAQDLYNQIQSGAITFEDACKQVTAQDSEGINFDYVAYTPFIEQPDQVAGALANMQVGDIVGPITTDNYTYLLKCVDLVDQDETWSLNLLPEKTQNYIKNYIAQVASSNTYTTELQKKRDEIGVVKYNMPPGTPYARGIFD